MGNDSSTLNGALSPFTNATRARSTSTTTASPRRVKGTRSTEVTRRSAEAPNGMLEALALENSDEGEEPPPRLSLDQRRTNTRKPSMDFDSLDRPRKSLDGDRGKPNTPKKTSFQPPATSPQSLRASGSRYSHIEQRVGVAIIGMEKRLLQLLALFLSEHAGLIDILAFCDESKDTIQAARDDLWQFGSSIEFTKEFSDYRKVLQIPGIEWVLIGSKTVDHRDHCIEALKLGKNVFCTGPMGITVKSCEEIRRASLNSNNIFLSELTLRNSLFFNKISDVITSGKLGKLVSIEASHLLSPTQGSYSMGTWHRNRAQAGPFILDRCSDDIDAINYIIGSLPTRVAAFGGLCSFVPENKPQNTKDEQVYNSDKLEADVFAKKDIDDNLVVILEYRDNIRVSYHANANCAIPTRKIVICGTRGALEGDFTTGQITFQSTSHGASPIVSYIHGKGTYGAELSVITQLAAIMENGTVEKNSTLPHAFSAAMVCLAIDRARNDKSIINLEPYWTNTSLGGFQKEVVTKDPNKEER